ncbi:MAG TPA: DUF4870 domain-containing protein [Bacillota bacterium]|nr:DUF4870 domain-containing protein [Bacillota bacterium]
MAEKEERMWAMLCHLSVFLGNLIPFGHIIFPLIIWQIKKNDSDFIDYHGKEALNFQISATIYLFISLILTVFLIGFLLMGALWLFNMVIVIIAAIRANNGERYQYPLCFRFIK